MKKILLFLVISFLIFPVWAQKGKKSFDLKKIDIYIESARKDWKIPGLAIAMVKDSQVIFSKGYGVREINKSEMVDDKTLFAIASNTKAFTSAALAILVDQGKISWDDKVTKYLPYFQLYDPFVTHEMTIRDLLCHKSGLETFSGDLLWYQTNYSRKEVIERARFLKNTSSFRTQFGYSNIMFSAAGEIIPVVTGKSWEDFISEQFLQPLGMTTTTTSVSKLKDAKNVATPHTEKDGINVAIPYLVWDNVAPAAAINSNINELSNWLLLQLNQGTWKGKKFFSKESSWNMWSPQTIINVSRRSTEFFPTRHFSAYGLGWQLFDYHGRKIVCHGGGADGMISQTVLVPEEKFGFVVLTNSINSLPSALMYKVLDEYLGEDGKDWSKFFLERNQQQNENELKQKQKAENDRIKNTNPSLSLNDYEGIYTGELYGDAKVSVKNGHLVVNLVPAPILTSDLSHWHFDTFKLKLRNIPGFPEGTARFIIDINGKVDEMKIDIPNPDFDFTELKFMKKK